MHLILHPIPAVPGLAETTVHVSGETLTVDGVAYDLSAVPESGEATPEGDGHPFVGSITRISGVIHAEIYVSYDPVVSEVHHPADPAHWVIEDAAGEIELPVLRKPEPEGEGDGV